MDSEREYLFGLMSVLNRVVSADQLADAMTAWKRETRLRPIADILSDRGWLDLSTRETVDRLVDLELDRLHSLDSSDETPRPARRMPGIPRAHYPSTDSATDREMSTIDQLASGLGPDDRGGNGPLPDFGARYEAPVKHNQGGMKVIYLARDRKLGRQVAIATLNPRLKDNDEARERFLAEARVTAELDHPNIVPIHDLVEFAEPPFYSMPFYQGRTLKSAIETHHRPAPDDPFPRLTLRELLENFVAVCHAIAFAHSRDTIHRDIKGANVQIDSFGRSIVLDWGLARRMSKHDDPLGRRGASMDAEDSEPPAEPSLHSTTPGSAIGTINYIPPEQARGDLSQIGPRSDIFGLGALLYIILTGQPPYHGEGALARARVADFPDPGKVNPAAPKPLVAICRKAMGKEPADRYAKAELLAEDVRRWLADEAVSVLPEPFLTRAGRWVRKHQKTTAGAAMVLVTAIAGLTIDDFRVSREKAHVEEARKEADRQFLDARITVQESMVALSDIGLVAIPRVEQVRRRLIEKALQFSKVFLSRDPNNPELREEAAKTYRRVSLISRIFGDLDRARQTGDEGLDFYRGLYAQFPDNGMLASDLALSLEEMAEVAQLAGDPKAAMRYDEEAMQICDRRSAAERGREPDPRLIRSTVLVHKASLQLDQGQPGAAAASCDEACRLIQAATPGFNPLAFLTYDRALLLRGQSALVSGRPERAINELERCIGNCGNLLADMDRMGADNLFAMVQLKPNVRATRAGAHRVLADALASIPSRKAGALAKADLAVRQAAELVAEFPNLPEFALDLVAAHESRASIRERADLRAEAAEDVARARALRDELSARHPNHPGVRRSSAAGPRPPAPVTGTR